MNLYAINNLEKYISDLRQSHKGCSVVHCHGVFDILHPGHIDHLLEAKSLGDVLVVTVTDDKYVNKGPGRPIQNAKSRAKILSSLKFVDFVAISEHKSALEVIRAVKPTVYVKGPDYINSKDDISGNIVLEQLEVEKYGGRIHFTNAPTQSSSKIINDSGIGFSSEITNYLNELKEKITPDDILAFFEKVKSLKILIIGETIIDEYLTCEALGKSSKDPVLAFREVSLERQLGGSLAIANHCANLGAQVSVLSKVGESDDDLNFITSSLNPTIKSNFVRSNTDPTIVKRRFVDDLTQFRVFETYTMSNKLECLEDLNRQSILYSQIYKEFDLIVICDYGHGFMGSSFINTIVNSNARLAINTQSNAGNRGINSIAKYSKVDFLSLNGSEVGLELRKRDVDMQSLLPELMKKTGAQRVLVTEGAKGLSFAEDDKFSHSPALAQKVVDRVGAGDAVFATSSLLFGLNYDLEISGYLSNLSGAIAISDLGNRKTLNSTDLAKFATSLLK